MQWSGTWTVPGLDTRSSKFLAKGFAFLYSPPHHLLSKGTGPIPEISVEGVGTLSSPHVLGDYKQAEVAPTCSIFPLFMDQEASPVRLHPEKVATLLLLQLMSGTVGPHAEGVRAETRHLG